MTGSPIETEIKLRATAPIDAAELEAATRAAGFDCQLQDPRHHVDTYLDDEHGTLAAAGIGLRVRRGAAAATVCVKGPTAVEGMAVARPEVELEWPATELPADAAALPEAVRDLVEPRLLRRPLRVWLQLQIERQVAEVRRDAAVLAELALDHGSARHADRQAAFVEIELEVRGDLAACSELARDLQRALPVQCVRDSKLAHAAGLLGLPMPGTPPVAAADTPWPEQLRTRLLHHFTAMAGEETGVRSSGDVECLHRMRVANRRLRALVRAFRSYWPEESGRWLRRELLATGRALGQVRDLDVLLAGIAADAERLPSGLATARQQLEPWLVRRRDLARAELLTFLRSEERLAAQERIAALLATAAPPAAETATTAAPAVTHRLRQAARLLRRLLQALPADLPLPAVHELRIAGKRLRYLAEEFAPWLEDGPDRALRRLRRLQEVLGAVCDHAFAAGHLLEMSAPFAAASREPHLGAALLGALAAAQEISARKARRRAARHLARLDRKRFWRALTRIWKR